MKSISLLLIGIFSFQFGFSQYNKMLTDNSEWHSYFQEVIWLNQLFTIGGDSTINGELYKIIQRTNSLGMNEQYFMREDTIEKRVYQYYNGIESLQYDFKMQVGDTFFMPNNAWIYGVDFIILDSIINNLTYVNGLFLANNISLDIVSPRVFYLSDTTLWQTVFIWIEGIGSLRSPCNQWDHTLTLLCHYNNEGFRDYHCFYDTSCTGFELIGINNDLLKEDAIRIFPNPVKEKVRIVVKGFREVELYGLSGQLLIHCLDSEVDLSQLKRGVYVIKVRTRSGIYLEKIIKQ
jgi:hypothetical protein